MDSKDNSFSAGKSNSKLESSNNLSTESKLMLEESRSRFLKIVRENQEYVTNTNVALHNEEGDSIFQSLEQDKKLALIKESADESTNTFNELMQKWEDSVDNKTHRKLPRLRELLLWQKQKSEMVLKQKDEAIQELKEMLNTRRKKIIADRSNREDQIAIVCDRVKHLVDNIDKSARDEVELIRKLFTEEQNQVVDLSTQSFVTHNEKREEFQEINYDDLRESICDRYRLFQQHKLESYNQLQPVRIELAKELQKLRICLSETNNKLMDNMEKLRYGLYVIDLQLKECRLIKNKTVRSKIHYFDQQVKLKKLLGRFTSQEEVKKTEEYKRKQLEKFEERQNRMNFIHGVNERKYADLFHVRRREVKSILQKIFDIDKTIFCDILNTKFETPNLSFLDWIVMDVSSEEQRLRDLLNSFLEKSVAPMDSCIQIQPLSDTTGTTSSIPIKRPLEIQPLMRFVFESLSFLVSADVKDFAKQECPETVDFMISNCFFPAVGIYTVDHLGMFLAHMLNRTESNDGGHEVTLSSKNVINAFEDWRAFYNSKMELSKSKFRYSSKIDPNQNCIWELSLKAFSKPKEVLWDEIYKLLLKNHSELRLHFKLRDKIDVKKRFITELARMVGVQL